MKWCVDLNDYIECINEFEFMQMSDKWKAERMLYYALSKTCTFVMNTCESLWWLQKIKLFFHSYNQTSPNWLILKPRL